jgi:hypothetical protein
MRSKKFTVTGPGVEATATASALGLSKAINFASRASKAGTEGSFYVRDSKGEVVGRTDADGLGNVNVYGERCFA